MNGTTVITLDRDISCFRKIHKSCFPWRHTLVHASQDKTLTAYYYWHSLATVFLIEISINNKSPNSWLSQQALPM